MSKLNLLNKLVKEAELYRVEGLLKDSKLKYLQAFKFIESNPNLSNRKNLMQAVKRRIGRLEKEMVEIDKGAEIPELSQDVQDLIKRLFSFAQTPESAAMEGAVALAKFGQYEKALTEFERMMEEGLLPLMAAKNIVRGYMSLSSPEAAISQYTKWSKRNVLSEDDLNSIRAFLQNILQKEGITTPLPPVGDGTPEIGKNEKKDEGHLDISSISVALTEGSQKGSSFEFDVCFQSGNVISILISEYQTDLLDIFKLGGRLSDVEYFSPMAVFKGSGIISGKTQIKQGPNRGNYVLDITMTDNR